MFSESATMKKYEVYNMFIKWGTHRRARRDICVMCRLHVFVLLSLPPVDNKHILKTQICFNARILRFKCTNCSRSAHSYAY